MDANAQPQGLPSQAARHRLRTAFSISRRGTVKLSSISSRRIRGGGRRLWDADAPLIPEIPAETVRIVISGAAVAYRERPGRAEAVYFESKAGAKVFNAGTIWWSWGLGNPGFEQAAFKTLNSNLVSRFLDT